MEHRARTSKALSSPGAPTTSNAISALTFSPDGRFLALLFGDSTALALLDLSKGTWTRADPPLTGVAPSGNPSSYFQIPTPPVWMPDSRSLWTGGGTNSKVQQWSAPDSKILRELPVSGPVAVSGDGRTLATKSLPKPGEPNGIWLWSIG